jgi:hypothetical protein
MVAQALLRKVTYYRAIFCDLCLGVVRGLDNRRPRNKGEDMRFIRTLYTAVLMVPTLALAQNAPSGGWPIAAGSRARILSPVLGDRAQTGSVVSATSDTLIFLPHKTSNSTAISTPNIVRLDVSSGTHTNKLKGALLGFAIGAGAGAVIGSATYKPCTNCFDILGRGGAIAGGSIVGGLVGLSGGWYIGSRASDSWVPVAVPVR